MNATSTAEPPVPEMPAAEPEIPAVHLAWATYDLAEHDLWEEYAADRGYLAGKVYLAGEQFARRRCDQAVLVARYARTPVVG